MLDETHDPERQSWVDKANGHSSFPIQNLPIGIFAPSGSGPRGGFAIGDSILDITAGLAAELFAGLTRDAAEAASDETLNRLLAGRQALRRRVSEILSDVAFRPLAPKLLPRATDCVMHLPARVGNFSDFFAGIHHVTTAGSINRPENPLLPNYKYVPVAYHGRASSVRVSGAQVRRPHGQRKPPNQAEPDFGPCRNLDYELELDVWIGEGNDLGTPIPINEAGRHIGGLCLLNDWSARHPGLGISAPRPVPGEEPVHLGLALDRHRRGSGAVSHAAAAAADQRSGAAAAPARSGGPGAWLFRHRVRGAAADAGDAHGGDAAASPVHVERVDAVLDLGADDRAPHLQRLQSAARGPAGQRHSVRH